MLIPKTDDILSREMEEMEKLCVMQTGWREN